MKFLLTILLISFCFVGYGQLGSDYKFYKMDGKDSTFIYTGWMYECHLFMGNAGCDSVVLVADSVRKRYWYEPSCIPVRKGLLPRKGGGLYTTNHSPIQ